MRTEADLARALDGAVAAPGVPAIIRVMLDPTDTSPATRRLAERFGAAAQDAPGDA